MRAECGPRTSIAISRAISRISRCSRKKPESRWWRISASSSSSRVRASPRWREAAVAALQLERADLRQLGVGHRVVGRRVAVAEIAREVEAPALGQLGRLARGLGQVAEQEPPSRAGSSARARGCRAARPRRPRAGDACGWRPARPAARPAAGRGRARRSSRRGGSPKVRARSSSRRLRARSPRQSGRCSSTRRPVAAERLAQQPAALQRDPLVGVHERAVARAAA